MIKKFKLKQDYIIPAGTEFQTDDEFSFTGESEGGWASNMSPEGWQGSCMIVDTPWMECQPDLFEKVED